MANERRKHGETAEEIQERTAQNRLERLRDLINEEYDGRVAYFCRKHNLGRSRASHISQVLNGKRKLGEQGARKLEIDCGLAQRYLDKAPKKKAEAEASEA